MAGRRNVQLALAVEGSLGVLAVGLGWLLGHSPLQTLAGHDLSRVGWLVLLGLLATLPMILVFGLVEMLPVAALRETARLVERIVARLFSGVGPLWLLAVSLAAGVGEELLFRGLLQDGLGRWLAGPWGPSLGLVLASIAFGLAHPLSGSYIVLAALNGAYLGWLMMTTGSLVTPIVAHAAYDFIALYELARRPPAGTGARTLADSGLGSDVEC